MHATCRSCRGLFRCSPLPIRVCIFFFLFSSFFFLIDNFFFFLFIFFIFINSGESFYYSQNIATIQQLVEGVTLEFPEATLYLPPNFHDQLAFVINLILFYFHFFIFLFYSLSVCLLSFCSFSNQKIIIIIIIINRITKKQQMTQ